jgi:hypothetical protein
MTSTLPAIGRALDAARGARGLPLSRLHLLRPTSEYNKGYEAIPVGPDPDGKVPANWNTFTVETAGALGVRLVVLPPITEAMLREVSAFGYTTNYQTKTVIVYEIASSETTIRPDESWQFVATRLNATFVTGTTVFPLIFPYTFAA